MDESSQPLANGTSATLRPPMAARASSGLARAAIGAGALVALMATPSAWAAAWPGLPAAQAVQLVNVNAEGAPALDRPADVKGLEKRTHGSTVGAVAIFGNPALALAFAPVRVAEGIADALALAARYEGPAVATLGTAGLRDQTETLTNWLTNAPRGVMVHADADANAAGAEAARVLCRRIRLNGAEARAASAHREGCGGSRKPETFRGSAGILRGVRRNPTGDVSRLAQMGDRPRRSHSHGGIMSSARTTPTMDSRSMTATMDR